MFRFSFSSFVSSSTASASGSKATTALSSSSSLSSFMSLLSISSVRLSSSTSSSLSPSSADKNNSSSSPSASAVSNKRTHQQLERLRHTMLKAGFRSKRQAKALYSSWTKQSLVAAKQRQQQKHYNQTSSSSENEHSYNDQQQQQHSNQAAAAAAIDAAVATAAVVDPPTLREQLLMIQRESKKHHLKSVPAAILKKKREARHYSRVFNCNFYFQEDEVTENSCLGRGPGGQATNRRMQTCQLKHLPTGLCIRMSKFRSLYANRKAARIMLSHKLEQIMFGKYSRLGEVVAKNHAKSEKRKRGREKLLRLHEKLQKRKEWVCGKVSNSAETSEKNTSSSRSSSSSDVKEEEDTTSSSSTTNSGRAPLPPLPPPHSSASPSSSTSSPSFIPQLHHHHPFPFFSLANVYHNKEEFGEHGLDHLMWKRMNFYPYYYMHHYQQNSNIINWNTIANDTGLIVDFEGGVSTTGKKKNNGGGSASAPVNCVKEMLQSPFSESWWKILSSAAAVTTKTTAKLEQEEKEELNERYNYYYYYRNNYNYNYYDWCRLIGGTCCCVPSWFLAIFPTLPCSSPGFMGPQTSWEGRERSYLRNNNNKQNDDDDDDDMTSCKKQYILFCEMFGCRCEVVVDDKNNNNYNNNNNKKLIITVIDRDEGLNWIEGRNRLLELKKTVANDNNCGGDNNTVDVDIGALLWEHVILSAMETQHDDAVKCFKEFVMNRVDPTRERHEGIREIFAQVKQRLGW